MKRSQADNRLCESRATYLDHIAPQQVIEAVRMRYWQAL